MEKHLGLRSTLTNLTLILLSSACVFLSVAASARASVDPAPSASPSRIVLNPTAQPATSQFVTWRTDAGTITGKAEIAPAAGGPATTVPSTPGDPVNFADWTYSSIHHSVTFTGLAPDTTYRYRVGGDTGWSEWMEFRTAKPNGDKPWKLLYFGDAQNNLDTSWRPVVERAYENSPDAEFALYAGDLINRSSNDFEWGQWFDGLAGHTSRINTMPITGNHEKSGDSGGIQFREHFTNPGNGPADAAATVWYTDYQGVRMIALDGNGTAAYDQVEFLREALKTNPHKWSIVSIHQPVFSGAVGRDNLLIRMLMLPVIEEYNVDLVLQGHDHVYARGHLDSFKTTAGTQTGPVFVVSVAGPKYYALAPDDVNNWNLNGATRVTGYGQTSTYQPITFDGDRIHYRSYIAAKGEESTATGQIGDLADSFTIVKKADGSKVVHEGIVERQLDTGPKPVGKLKVNKVSSLRRAGAARVAVTLPAAGTLRVTGKAKGKRFNGIRPLIRKSGKAKRLSLKLTPTGKAKRVLKRRGRLKVKTVFTFRPKSGKAQKVTRTVTLIRKGR
ncbi:MAG: metallophosphoesterase family protein [Actinomycetota bacterium]|nr:metallophosphoesterase family protein [Actinomycetota bacterium]